MALLVLLLVVLVPVAELYTLIQVGSAIGALDTIGLLLLVGFVGGWLVKRAGIGVARRISEALAQRRVPSDELIDAVVVLVAGALFVFPGFLSDVVALLLLLPPVRALVRHRVKARLRLRVEAGPTTRVYEVRGRDLEP
jgi:UPF0716 protein FxsA